jgi:hypothetical protein
MLYSPATVLGENNNALSNSELSNQIVQSSDPVQGSTNVPVDKTISVTFSVYVHPSENWKGITLNNGDSQTVVNLVYDSDTLYIEHGKNLEYNTTYTISIPADSINMLESSYNFCFITEAPPVDMSDSKTPPPGYSPTPSNEIKKTIMQSFAVNVQANDTNRVLLVQTSLPWDSTANQVVLSSLNMDYTLIGIDQLPATDLTDYKVIIIANDQKQAFYNKYAEVKTQLEEHIAAGGIVVIGACDLGWAKGSWTTTLPGGVKIIQNYEPNNIVADASHPIITGQLTDGNALKDEDLYSNFCSHREFDESTLPEGSKVILRAKTSNRPTLVEYHLGKGRVIASGLTWEHNYVQHTGSDSYGTFARKAMDDYFLYAMSGANYSDYTSAVTISLIPTSVAQGQDLNINLNVNQFDGKRDFYFYMSGQNMERVWWDGSKWTSTLTSVGRYTNQEFSSSTLTWNINLPVGLYTIGAALIGQGTAMSPRSEYEASFNVTNADQNVELGTKVGMEYEQIMDLSDIPPSLDTITVDESDPYSRGELLHLKASASDADDPQRSLFYFWSVDKGTLQGSITDQYQSVQWLLPNYPGTYTVQAFVGDGRGLVSSKTLAITVK